VPDPASASPRRLRSDAARNRERILAAARLVFAEQGIAAGFTDIAKRAGVGVGTVYRRFPDRDHLISALFDEEMHDFVAMIEEATGHEDAWQGLCFMLEQALERQASDRGLRDLLSADAGGRDFSRGLRDLVAPKVDAMIRRAQAAGHVRPDVGPADIAQLTVMVSATIDASTPDEPDLWRRYLVLGLEGFRCRPDLLPLPGGAPDEGAITDRIRAASARRASMAARRGHAGPQA
jgi:AcrR family transcriptional regulator